MPWGIEGRRSFELTRFCLFFLRYGRHLHPRKLVPTAMNEIVTIGEYQVGNGQPLLFIAGPCVMESEQMVMQVAEHLATLQQKTGSSVVFLSLIHI